MIVVIAIATVTFSSCDDKDTTSPQVFLLGDNPYYITLNDKYVEFGFEVNDNRDDSASLTIEIDIPLDTLEEEFLSTEDQDIYLGIGATIEVGEFIVTYTITDKAGNETVVERNIIIANSLAKYNRVYDVIQENITNPDSEYEPYQMELEAHENLNNRIWFPRFSNFEDYNLTVYADIKGDSIFIPYQSFVEDNNYFIEGEDDENNGFAGLLNSSSYTFDITYTASNNSTGALVFHEVLTKF